MRGRLSIWLAGALASVATSAAAQNPERLIFELFRGVEQTIQQQEQFRRNQRIQQQQQQEQYQRLLQVWRSCFAGDLDDCNATLEMPNLTDNDRPKVLRKRSELIAARDEAEAKERREREEEEASERREREEAEARERDERLARERREREEAEEAARIRRARLAAEESERRQRELRAAEERGRIESVQRGLIAGRAAFDDNLAGCGRGDNPSCYRALAFAEITPAQREIVERLMSRGVGDWFNGVAAKARAWSLHAYDLALDTPRTLANWRVELDGQQVMAGGLVGSFALLLVFAGARMRRMFRPAAASHAGASPAGGGAGGPAQPAASSSPPPASRPAAPPPAAAASDTFVSAANRIYDSLPLAPQGAPARPAAAAPRMSEPKASFQDTKVATREMELAWAHMREVHEELGAIMEPANGPDARNTLSLASKHLSKAEQADPDAKFTTTNIDGSPLTFTMPHLKAQCLFYEGITFFETDKKKAVRILEQAIAMLPDAPMFHYWLGMLHLTMLNKREAIACAERALAYDADNIDFHKLLDRAQAISGAQMAFDRTQRGVKTTVNVARNVWLATSLFLIGWFVISLIRGDALTAFMLFILFAILGAFMKGVEFVKGWFRSYA